MAYVRQRNKTDCGVAALAMLCDVTYEEANQAIPWRREGHLSGTTTAQLREGGLRLGFETVSTPQNRLKVVSATSGRTGRHPPVMLWSTIPSNSLVKIPVQYNWHWVVWKEKLVLDPYLGMHTPENYFKKYPACVPSSYMEFIKCSK